MRPPKLVIQTTDLVNGVARNLVWGCSLVFLPERLCHNLIIVNKRQKPLATLLELVIQTGSLCPRPYNQVQICLDWSRMLRTMAPPE